MIELQMMIDGIDWIDGLGDEWIDSFIDRRVNTDESISEAGIKCNSINFEWINSFIDYSIDPVDYFSTLTSICLLMIVIKS